MNTPLSRNAIGLRPCAAGVALALVITSACRSPARSVDGTATATPVYSQRTGRLEQLVADRNGDGKIDTRAYMDGVRLKHIEIDLNGDERPDRWEYYVLPAHAQKPGVPTQGATIDRAEQASGPDHRITRREFYVDGVIERVEEDTDVDGRPDKWEWYKAGALARVDLDLRGKGFADRRLIYRADGSFGHVEEDLDGDGKFQVTTSRSKGTSER